VNVSVQERTAARDAALTARLKPPADQRDCAGVDTYESVAAHCAATYSLPGRPQCIG